MAPPLTASSVNSMIHPWMAAVSVAAFLLGRQHKDGLWSCPRNLQIRRASPLARTAWTLMGMSKSPVDRPIQPLAADGLLSQPAALTPAVGSVATVDELLLLMTAQSTF